MNVATSVEVGVRELKNHLSAYLERIAAGDDVIVTDRGRPVARLTRIDAPTERLAALIAAGFVAAPASRIRRRPNRRITSSGEVSALVADQRQ